MHIQHTQESIQPWRIHSGGYKDQANTFHTSSNFWRPDCLLYLCTLLNAVSITESIYKSVESYLLQSTLFRCSLMSREILHVLKIMLIYIKILQSNSKVTSKFHFDQILFFFFCRRSWEKFLQKKPANFIFWTISPISFQCSLLILLKTSGGSKGNIRKNWYKDLCQNSFLISSKFKWINQLLFFYNFNKSMLTDPIMFFLRNIADHKKTCIFPEVRLMCELSCHQCKRLHKTVPNNFVITSFLLIFLYFISQDPKKQQTGKRN